MVNPTLPPQPSTSQNPTPSNDAFRQAVAQLLQKVAIPLGLSVTADELAARIEHPPDDTMGDYALPCFMFARHLRQAPSAIASQLASAAQSELQQMPQPLLHSASATGAYVNVLVNATAMAQQTLPAILSEAYFKANQARSAKKVMVEYSQPNTHKSFHVGHMRNLALGQALVRLLRYNGRKVIAANYIGDIGTHIARCLWHIHHLNQSEPAQAKPPSSQEGPEARGEWLGEMYVQGMRRLAQGSREEQAKKHAEVGDWLRRLEAREDEAQQLWQKTRQWSIEAFEAVYHWFNVQFDHVFYESEMDVPGKAIVQQGLKEGVFVRSQGAIGVDLDVAFKKEKTGKLGFFLALKADGTSLYATKDLALAQIKFNAFKVEEAVYVVGAEQSLHLKQVFYALRLLGFQQAKHCHHLAYGLVVLPEGKMSSRAGNAPTFSSLRKKMKQGIYQQYLHTHQGEWQAQEIEETTQKIAVASLCYGMLKQDPDKQIVFHLQDWLSSEGDTGAYLCYAYTRIQSVLRQAAQKGWQPTANVDFSLLSLPIERTVIRQLHDFNKIAARAADTLRPNLLANALFLLCKNFNRAYNTAPVLRAHRAALGQARLSLFMALGKVLHQGMSLLGMPPPNRM